MSGNARKSLPEQQAFIAIQRAADTLMRDFEPVFTAAGLSPTQYNVLRILRGAGIAVPCGEIAARMITRDPDMTRLLDRLETRGLVARARDARDRRVVRARITDAGRAILKDLDEPILAAHRAQLGHLGKHKLEQLLSLLDEAVVNQQRKPT